MRAFMLHSCWGMREQGCTGASAKAGTHTHEGRATEWEPLLYVCFSRFASNGSTRAAQLVTTAQALLRAGADANASYIHEGGPIVLSRVFTGPPGSQQPGTRARAAGRGCAPNDGESLYHSTEHADLACVKLLLKHGATPKNANVLNHMLDARIARVAASAGRRRRPERSERARRDSAALGDLARAECSRDRGAVGRRSGIGNTAQRRTDSVRSGSAERADCGGEVAGNREEQNTELSPIDRFIGACESANTGELERLSRSSGDRGICQRASVS